MRRTSFLAVIEDDKLKLTKRAQSHCMDWIQPIKVTQQRMIMINKFNGKLKLTASKLLKP